MDLMKAMLQKDPRKRISSTEALMHPAFCNVLSKSPLHAKHMDFLNTKSLAHHTELTHEQKKMQKKDKTKPNMIPDDINDFYSPNTPAYNKNRKKSVDILKKDISKLKVKK